MRLFDTHAHLADEALWPHLDALVARMEQFHVSQSNIICTQLQDLIRGEQALLRFPNKFVLSAATGPNESLQDGDHFFPYVEELARKGVLTAIGEIGLDRHWDTSPIDVQQDLFIRYLKLARLYELPIIIHCRRAFGDILELLDNHYVGLPGASSGVFHCFAEGLDEAQEVIKRGLIISFSGIVTYKSASHLQQVACSIGCEHYVIETDSPYLNPGKNRQALNEPSHVAQTAAWIANWRGQTLSEVARDTYINACRLFKIPSAAS